MFLSPLLKVMFVVLVAQCHTDVSIIAACSYLLQWNWLKAEPFSP